MNKVVSMNLNGNAYQLDEPGYTALSEYLTEAKAQLAGNPDQAEILADLEQAIADKLRRFLSGHKSVVTADEVQTVIAEMGPVEGGKESTASEEPLQTTGPKRLYRIEEGKWIAGVATGLAAYLNVEVHIVRIVMIILLLLTHGGLVFGYLLAWIFIPRAITHQQQAKAHGAPFNAEEVIARAKSAMAQGRAEGIEHWKSWRKQHRAERKVQARAWKQSYKWNHQGKRHSSFGQLIWLIVLTFFVWLGYQHVPDIHQFLDSVWALVHRIGDWIAQLIVSNES